MTNDLIRVGVFYCNNCSILKNEIEFSSFIYSLYLQCIYSLNVFVLLSVL